MSFNKTVIGNEQGLALLMTVFIVTLATILVLDFSGETMRYQRQCRMFQERVQADLMLKSAIGLAQGLIEFPKPPGREEDSLTDLWSVVASEPSLPIPGFIGEPKLLIVDESSKININAILPSPPPGGISSFWREALKELFLNQGFADEDYPPEDSRTLGNKGFNAYTQVAVISDWIDTDQLSLNDNSFQGQGIETQTDKRWFFNRPLNNISEIALIPGMTLERLARISRYVRTDPRIVGSFSKINVNTASPEVLQAIGFDQGQVLEIMRQRLDPAIDQPTLSLIVQGSTYLPQVTSVKSQQFSAYVKIVMPNVTRWARAIFDISGASANRISVRSYLEIM